MTAVLWAAGLGGEGTTLYSDCALTAPGPVGGARAPLGRALAGPGLPPGNVVPKGFMVL